MEKIVYVLGAGFSAPFGLPVMANFLEKSKDIYVNDEKRYSHFQSAFDLMKKLAQSKTYYAADLTNIEEVLSILEMQEELNGASQKRSYATYIEDVIKHFTPEAPFNPGSFPKAWIGQLFEYDNPTFTYRDCGYFIASLLSLRFLSTSGNSPGQYIWCELAKEASTSYSIVTVNYDMLVEMFVEYWRFFSWAVEGNHGSDRIKVSIYERTGRTLDFPIAKLHGSVGKGNIIPPTWNKFFAEELSEDWKMAYRYLMEANQIRIIGYSLPETDSYLKYLLKAAVLESFNLKNIDVICLDKNGSIRRRFEEFITYPKMRFVNGDVTRYWAQNFQLLSEKFSPNQPRTFDDGNQGYTLDRLEEAHSRFMNTVP